MTILPKIDVIDLSIVIVNWNVRELLRRCLASIFVADLPRMEVIVVDNASSDGSSEMLRAEFPQVMLLANAHNRGFPAGNNQAFAVARGRYVMTLNPDTELIGQALTGMLAYLDAHPQVGALGPQLLNPDGSIQSSRRRFPTLSTALFESTWLQGLAPHGVLQRYYMEDIAPNVMQEVDWLVGACILVRREVLQTVGGFDEAFFMYSEELDWCKRIQSAGWKIVYLPEAKVIHHTGRSSEQAVAARHIHFQTSKVRYFRKHHGRWAAGVLRLLLLGMYVWQLGLESAKALLGHKRSMRRQRIGVYWQVLRSGLR
ncbi:MAG TPA: glycosyltransferase family 2 protein [Anaerolineae bacterium]|nr:glycosyltransferase family 2 protein [Anaerolineae bacterium]